MIVPDANLLVYAYQPDSPHQEPARHWLEDLLSGSETVGLAWTVVLAFLRVTTHPRIFLRPLALEAAADAVASWLDCPSATLLPLPDRHWPELAALLHAAQARGPVVMDGHLAALTIAYGATLHTHDRGFARFPGLRWHDPLA